MNRWALFVGGIVASVAVTAFLWTIGMPGFFLFLAFPFFLLPFSRHRSGRSSAAPGQSAEVDRDGRFAGAGDGDRSRGGLGQAGGWRQGVQRRCPACGRRSQDPDERHCKHDGAPMVDGSA